MSLRHRRCSWACSVLFVHSRIRLFGDFDLCAKGRVCAGDAARACGGVLQRHGVLCHLRRLHRGRRGRAGRHVCGGVRGPAGAPRIPYTGCGRCLLVAIPCLLPCLELPAGGWHSKMSSSCGMQARAADTGAYLMERLRALQERFPFLGDVRGTGLMIGIEVRARAASCVLLSLPPSTRETSLCQRSPGAQRSQWGLVLRK